MGSTPSYCMEALRSISADTTLDAASRYLAAERAIKHYLEQAGTNSSERQNMLLALDKEISAAETSDFWSTVRDIVAQLRNS